MSFIETLVGGNAGKFIKDVVGTFKLSPEAQKEFEAKMAENDFRLKQMDAELEQKLADTASANIRAESASGDKYTSRARPTFLYITEAILLWNFVVVPLFHRSPVDLPEPLFWLFGSVMLGYTGARTWEKIYQKK